MENKTVLIVDDEPDVAAVLSMRIAGFGYSVITANSGAEAIALAESEQPDLIMLDILMPDMDGGQVAQELHDKPATQDIPVIFASCLYPKEMEDEQGHYFGGHVMFSKPYDIDELRETIEQVIEKQ